MKPFKTRYRAYIKADKTSKRTANLISIIVMFGVLGACMFAELVESIGSYIVMILGALALGTICDLCVKRPLLRCFF